MADRICPLCEMEMAEDVCPEDGVPTIESSVFDAPEEAIQPGMIIAERYRIIRLCGRGARGRCPGGLLRSTVGLRHAGDLAEP